MTSAISRRYAKALVALGSDQGKVEKYGEELTGVVALLSREKALRLILESPTYTLDKKEAILADLVKALKLSPGMVNFLGLVLEKDRLKYLSQIEATHRQFADELSGVLRARIRSAADLGKAEVKAIQGALEKKTGKKVELKVEVEPALLGGIQAEIGGRVFDASLRTQLKRIEDTLTKG